MVSNPDVAALIEGSNGDSSPDRNERFWHIVYRAGALTAVAALIVGSVAATVAYVEQSATSAQSKCINRLLADRNGTSAADELAHADAAKADASWSQALTTLLTFPSTATDLEKQVELQAFVSAQRVYSNAMDVYSQTLADDQSYRAAHPLGKC